MFRHKGKRRAYHHNRRLASMLSLIAGMVNITGVLLINTLTTNVTGHFAFFAEELILENYARAFAFLIYINFFLLGSFVSSLIVEFASIKKPQLSHVFPMFLEAGLLTIIGCLSYKEAGSNAFIACTLLFAMGVQNSLVTHVSQSLVRTTHLTGLFTDLGIELSQLLFYRKKHNLNSLSKSIYLKLFIISFFFVGSICGGFLFKVFHLKTLLFAAGLVLIALIYDSVRYKFYFYKRKLRFR